MLRLGNRGGQLKLTNRVLSLKTEGREEEEWEEITKERFLKWQIMGKNFKLHPSALVYAILIRESTQSGLKGTCL